MSTLDSKSLSTDLNVLKHSWWIVLLIALAAHWLATERRIDRVEALTKVPTWSVSLPEMDDSSASGYEEGQRALIVTGHHNPSFHWIAEAQTSVEQGKLRMRSIDYDAYPDGRDMERTSPYRWWLVVVGWMRSSLTGEPIGMAIEKGALYSDPVLYALLLIVGSTYCARVFGVFPSIAFALGTISIFPLSANFQPGAPDSHSLSWLLALGSLLPLVAASKRKRIHFLVAGLLGALGFWNDAQAQAPFLLAIALGAVARELVSKDSRDLPWRAWSLPGSFLILLASSFEFDPSRVGWSLDVVSPLHAVIWLGFGEALIGFSAWRRKGNGRLRPRQIGLFALGIAAVCLWPAVGIWNESGSLLASDFYARELANHAQGGLASNLGVWLGRTGGASAAAVLLPCGIVALAIYRLCVGRAKAETRGRLAFLLVCGLLLLGLSFFQLRWFNAYDVVALALLAVLLDVSAEEDSKSLVMRFSPLVFVMPGIFLGFPPATKELDLGELSQMEKQALIARDFGYWLNKYSAAETTVLFSTPLFSGTSAYYGGFKSIVSIDDSNQAGLEAAARLAASDSLQEISILMESLKVTHVALPLWDPMIEQLVHLGLGKTEQANEQPHVFMLSLRDWDLPPFVGALNYPSPTERALQGFSLVCFAQQAEQENDLALSRLADLFVERGQRREAAMIRDVLESYPRSLYALAATANIDVALGDEERSKVSLESLVPYLSRRVARNIPLDRRVSISILLLKSKRIELAKEQLGLALTALDAESLRTLTPDSIAMLIAMSRSLGVAFSSSELEAEALEFVPLSLRSQLVKN